MISSDRALYADPDRHECAAAAQGARGVPTPRHDQPSDRAEDAVKVRSGYLSTSEVRDMGALASALLERFEHIRVGVHQGVEVVFGHDWSGPVPRSGQTITQAFTSTMALGGYSRDDGSPALATAREELLRGAYLATLLAALDLECHAVVLTLIGGGAFGNG
jgi:hypothetical protein